jgi:phosphoribosylformylglycinamidine synthase subunit PurQ / glutaminase
VVSINASTFVNMKFGVVVFPGSNCDRDMQNALETNLKQEVHMLWHKDNELNNFTSSDCIILPGGFSYGDYLRCGAIAKFSPMMQEVIKFANNGGKVLGVCNGFQILCEAGLLPGALLKNNSQKFECKNVYIKNSLNQVSKIPIAHGEGRYYANEETIASLQQNQQIIYTYCNNNGTVTDNDNPNGSLNNIAGIKNSNGNVFGMMPHPERATSQVLGNTDGISIFKHLQLLN